MGAKVSKQGDARDPHISPRQTEELGDEKFRPSRDKDDSMESQGEFLTKEIQLLAQSSANQLEKERIDSPNRFEGSSVEKCRILTNANPKFIKKRGADNISRELKEPLSLSKQENAGGPHGPVEFDEQVEMPSKLRSMAWSKDPAKRIPGQDGRLNDARTI